MRRSEDTRGCVTGTFVNWYFGNVRKTLCNVNKINMKGKIIR